MRTLITGGTGSLGQALVQRLLSDTQDEVLVLSRDEWKQAQMAERVNDVRVRYFLGDVRDEARLVTAFRGVDRVVHAAALKRVDAVAGEPLEVMKTNVLGTANVLSAARTCKVPRVLLVSTDKACEATNAYGASKYMAEQLTVSANSYGHPQGVRSSVVRYGNVFGSRGSVVQVWRGLANGEHPRLTDERMTRFVITMPQATRLVLSALAHMDGGETFVPLLPRMRMADLALAMFDDVPVSSGLRPGGEKLHETLLTQDEANRVTQMLWTDDFTVYGVRPHVSSWREWWGQDFTGIMYESSSHGPYLPVEQLKEMAYAVRDC